MRVAPEPCTRGGLGELEEGPKALVTLNLLSGGQSLLEGRGGGEPRRRGLPSAWGWAVPAPPHSSPCNAGESQSGYYFLLNILYVNKKIVSSFGVVCTVGDASGDLEGPGPQALPLLRLFGSSQHCLVCGRAPEHGLPGWMWAPRAAHVPPNPTPAPSPGPVGHGDRSSDGPGAELRPGCESRVRR